MLTADYRRLGLVEGDTVLDLGCGFGRHAFEAARRGAKPAEVALAWLIVRPGVTAPIASATSLEQVDSLIRAAELTLDAGDIEALDQASRP